MSAVTAPPFRADHIGSLLRPKELTQAFRAYSKHEIEDGAFHSCQDHAIDDVVGLQRSVGLKVVTDGEFRRASYWGHWVDAIEGLDVAEAVFKFYDDAGNEQKFIAADCVGPLKKIHPISTEEFKYLKSVAGDATPKITMPSPSTLHFWRGRHTLDGSGYAGPEAYFDDLCGIFRQEIADLAALGCRYVQLDEVPLIMLGGEPIREQVRGWGDDPDALTTLYIQAMNDAVRDRGGVTAAMHICRGNFKGKWLTEGGYDTVAERIFREIDVDAFCLEYDTERSGGFEPLRHVPDDKMVVLGLVSTKTPTLEDEDALVARIEEAARYVDKDRLCLSPQCGFASTVAGNPVTIDAERAKLELIVRVAERVWGEA